MKNIYSVTRYWVVAIIALSSAIIFGEIVVRGINGFIAAVPENHDNRYLLALGACGFIFYQGAKLFVDMSNKIENLERKTTSVWSLKEALKQAEAHEKEEQKEMAKLLGPVKVKPAKKTKKQ